MIYYIVVVLNQPLTLTLTLKLNHILKWNNNNHNSNIYNTFILNNFKSSFDLYFTKV